MKLNINQGSTLRGIVRLVSAVALVYASYKQDIEMIGEIVALEKTINGYLGVTRDG